MTPRLAGAAIAIALAGAVVLPDNRFGLGAAVIVVALVALAWAATQARRGWSAALLALASALALAPLFRDAEWIVVLDVMAAGAATLVAVSAATTWRAFAAAVRATPWRAIAAWPALARATAGPIAAGRANRFLPLARGVALGALVVVVFGALFVSADDAFAEIVDETVIPHWELGLLPARAFTFAFVGALGGALVLLAGAGPATAPAGAQRRRGRAEWVVPLVLLDLLFAAFVAVQIAVLFGGHDHVLETAGLTYAEYARAGFWELVIVAALTLGVIASAVRWASPDTPGDRLLLKVLLGVLCALTFVVLASALRRLGLYEDAFGFTRARLMAHVVILWLGAVFALVILAGALRRADWLPRAVVGLAAATLLGVTVANPDGVIARHNVDRFESTGKLDRDYVSGLSADAVPTLTGLPADDAGCILLRQRDRLADGDAPAELNVGRARARDALRANRAVCTTP